MRFSNAVAAMFLNAAAMSLVYGQSSVPVGVPKLGYLPDRGSIRPVYGISAAATAGQPIPGLASFAHIAGNPGGDFALVSESESGVVSVYQDLPAPQALTPIAGIGLWPDRLSLSPSGKSGIVWFSYLSRAQVITGLPAQPVWKYFDAPYLDPLPTALAVSDDGQWAAGAWPQGVYAFGPKGEVVRMQIEEPATSVVFAPAEHDFFVTTAQGILSVTDPGGRAGVTSLFLSQGESPLAAIAVAAAYPRVVTAARDGHLILVNPSDGSVLNVDCHCTPDGLSPMGTGLLRLTALQAGAFVFIDLKALDQPARDQEAPANIFFYVPVGLSEQPPETSLPASTGEGAAQ